MNLEALSASRINTNKECPFKYFLEYHIKFPPSRKSNIYAEKGSAIHEALEFYGNHIGKFEDAEKDYKKTLKKYYARTELWKLDDRKPEKGGDPYPQQKNCEICPWATKGGLCSIANIPTEAVDGCPKINFEQDLELIEQTINNKNYPIFKRKILGTEVQFNEDVGGFNVRGVIDLVTEIDSDTIEVIDYKSGNHSKSYEQARKDPQLRTYSLIAKRLWPEYRYALMTLYYIKKKPLSVIFSIEDDQLTLKSLEKAYRSISANESPSRVKSWLCNWCVGYDECGIIKDNFSKNGKFKLPTISCAHGPEGCWGSISPENPDDVDIHNAHLMTYACDGHYEIHLGGYYLEQDDSD